MTHRTLLVATPGGHVDELVEFAARIDDLGGERLWVTAETPHTGRILADEQKVWVSPVGSRQGFRAACTVPQAFTVLRRFRPTMLISTGAALAVPYFVAARALGVEAHYIESATRLTGPSATGRILARLPGVTLQHQGFSTPHGRWRETGNVFDAFRTVSTTARPIRTALVTVGTERFPFTRALAAISNGLPAGVSVTVQAGHTVPPDTLRGARKWVPSDELHQAMQDVDLVVTHAGVGSVLAALRAGKRPVVIPRIGDFGEHVDNHQVELAKFLGRRRLAAVVFPGGDLGAAISEATSHITVRADLRSLSLRLPHVKRSE